MLKTIFLPVTGLLLAILAEMAQAQTLAMIYTLSTRRLLKDRHHYFSA